MRSGRRSPGCVGSRSRRTPWTARPAGRRDAGLPRQPSTCSWTISIDTTVVANTPGSASRARFAAPHPATRPPSSSELQRRRRRHASRSAARRRRLDRNGERLRGEPVRRSGRASSRVREPELDAVGDLQAGLLAQRRSPRGQVEEARPSSKSSSSSAVSSATVTPSSLATAQPFAARPARRAPRPARARGRRPGTGPRRAPRTRRAAAPAHVDAAPRRASARAPAGSASRAAPTPRRRRTRPLDAELVARSRRRARATTAPCDDQPAQRLAQLELGRRRACRPSSTTRRTSRDLGEQLHDRARPRSGQARGTPSAAHRRARGSATGARRGTA